MLANRSHYSYTNAVAAYKNSQYTKTKSTVSFQYLKFYVDKIVKKY